MEQIRSLGRAVGDLYGQESLTEESLDRLEASILSRTEEAEGPDHPAA